MTLTATDDLVLAGQPLTVGEVCAVAARRRSIDLDEQPDLWRRVDRAHQAVQAAIDRGDRIYGVTTGFGGMAASNIPAEEARSLQHHLLTFLNAGAGPPIPSPCVRAAMMLRANMLLRGVSGVRPEIIRRMVRWVREDAIPVVREYGSIGASGDLVPLSAIARAITGQGGKCPVLLRGEELSSREVLRRLNLQPLDLQPKEALAIVNGTSFSAAISARCGQASRLLFALGLHCHGIMLTALGARRDPFHAFVHRRKPHPGQVWTASVMRDLIAPLKQTNNDAVSPQDRYSIRCLPQYVGPLAEMLARVLHVVFVEMNSDTDNPLIDGDSETFHQSGNFLGQYLGVAMDDLRRCLGLLAKHLDVQIAQLATPEFSQGLPPSLAAHSHQSFSMGLKGLQITANSIMPMLTYFGNPLVEHFPTHAEQHNQNINGLSWGAAHLARQSVDWMRHYVAIALMFSAQAADLRANLAGVGFDGRAILSPHSLPVYEAVYGLLDREPGAEAALFFDDRQLSFDDAVERLQADIAKEGLLATAAEDIAARFDREKLAC